MKKTREFGEFLPATMSPFTYSETIAQEYFPTAMFEDTSTKYLGKKYEIPDDIGSVEDDICEKVLTCETTQKPYKIIPQELQFYRRMGLPLPQLCPDERHRRRMARRNPRRLWQRQCGKCGKSIQTTYSPERPEIVYCETCYLQEVY